ncbi:hypothetical protein OC846_002454 [Tilletia horrida]|uniref:BTB domain-containing protein n=1 Tax=Tilletia horrida TaxID=155126 RepID=A0AAN6JSM6_9BASI|nr:hypothetical protein OC846_002454 [Tilletia horrida]KAK0567537.1 hypothetical protein OC861_002658 [Tilletia horrida]
MHGVYLNALCQHVSRFGFLDGRMSDIRIRAFGRVYHLHRLFLVQASFFNGLFCAGFAEGFDTKNDDVRINRKSARSRNGKASDRGPFGNRDVSDDEDEDDDGIVDLPFEDPNITRPAFEYCIAHLYGAAPELVLPEWASPQPIQPLSSAFIIPPSPGTGPVPQSATTVGNRDSSTNSGASGTTSPHEHPATPRFLLSLLATSIYLGIPSVTTHVITLILYSITPFTIMHYLRFANGQTILGASEAMQRSVMHELALAESPHAAEYNSMRGRPNVWDWELEGPLRGLEHLGKVQIRSSKRRTKSSSPTKRGDASGPTSLLQQTKNLTLHDEESSTGPSSIDGHHTTSRSSPQLAQDLSNVDAKVEEQSPSSHSLGSGSIQVKREPGDVDGKRAGYSDDSKAGTAPGLGLSSRIRGAEVHGPAEGRESKASLASEGSAATATDYQTDEAETASTATYRRSYPIRPPLMGDEDVTLEHTFRKHIQVPSDRRHSISKSGPFVGGAAGGKDFSAALSPPLNRSNNKRAQFYYGNWGEKMGEACACWLVRFGADILEEEITADEGRAADTEAWMIQCAQNRSSRSGTGNLGANSTRRAAAPWELALQIPSGDVSNSIYGAAGLPISSPMPFGKTSMSTYHSTPAGSSRAGGSSRWNEDAGGDGYRSGDNTTEHGRQTPDASLEVDTDNFLDAPDEDCFIQTYMLPYGQLPDPEQLTRPPPLLVWSLGHMGSDWVREIISSDSFFVRAEWDRFVFATRVVELRRRQKMRRLAVLKVCGYLADDDDEQEVSTDDESIKPDLEQASNASISGASLGEQWRRLTGQHSSAAGSENEQEDEDGDDEEEDDDDDFHLLSHGQHGAGTMSARQRQNTLSPRSTASKGKSAGTRSQRHNRSPASRRTSFASHAESPSDPRRSIRGSPGTPSKSRGQDRSRAQGSGKVHSPRYPRRLNKRTGDDVGLPRDSDEREYEDLFKKGIYYTHMSFDELNRISSNVSSMTGKTFVPLSVLQSALWAGSELKNHILSSAQPGPNAPSSGAADPPPQLPNMWPEHGADDNAMGGGGARADGQNGGNGMNNSATLPPIRDLNISSTLSEFRLAAEAVMKGNSSFHGPGKLFDPNLSYFMTAQDQTRSPISLGGHMASPLMLGAASKPGALLGKRYFPVLADSTVRLGGSTTPVFGSGTNNTSGGNSANLIDPALQVPPSPNTLSSGAMGVAVAKDPLAFTMSSTLQGGVQGGVMASGNATAHDGGPGVASGLVRNRTPKYFGISNTVRTGRDLAADATVLEEAQARAAEELSGDSSMSSASEDEDANDDKGADGEEEQPEKEVRKSRRQRKEDLIRNELETSRWTGYEPMRIGAEFYGVDTLADKQRMYSPTFFYAGSLWNLYVQTTKKSKGLQLGVYLHRQAPTDPLPVVNLPPVTVPRLLRRADDIPVERSTTPVHIPRDPGRVLHGPSAVPRQGPAPSPQRYNHGGQGNTPSLFLNIPTTPGLPIASSSNNHMGSSAGHTSSIVIASAAGPSTSSLPGANPSSLGGGSVVNLSSSPAQRSMAGPFLGAGTGSAANSIVANSQAPIPGSIGAGGGSLFQAVNARYQEVATADNAGHGHDAQNAHNGVGMNADASAQGNVGFAPLGSRDNSTTPSGQPVGHIGSTAPPPQVPYTDPRRELRAFFSIHCPSPLGSSLTRFSSGPDRFALTQSWGWKSSSLLMTMYLPERKLTEAKSEAHRFTAKLFIELLGEELAKGQSSIYDVAKDPDFTWALAGRSEKSLQAVADSLDLPPEKRPAIIIADVSDQDALLSMCKSTVLLLNAVGPYAFFGPPVLDAVLKASEEIKGADPSAPGVSYLDITGEPSFIEGSCLKNHRRAQELGITLLHAAGFDSVPADLGVLYAKRQLEQRSTVPTSIEFFFQLKSGRQGFGIHFATYASAINGFATRALLGQTRKALGKILPRPPKPAAVAVGLSDGLPKRTTRVPGILYAPEFTDLAASTNSQSRNHSRKGTYLLPFFFADPAVVRLSQALDSDLKTGVPSIKLAAWINIPRLRWLLLVIPALSWFGLLASFKLGRMLLLNFPKTFSFGRVSHEGPTKQQIKSTSFVTSLVARGHSPSLIEAAKTQGTKAASKPDQRINVLVQGPEPGYDSTPLCMLACVEVMLSPSQRDRVRRGALTPSVALAETNIFDVLERQPGGIRFKVVDPPKI